MSQNVWNGEDRGNPGKGAHLLARDAKGLCNNDFRTQWLRAAATQAHSSAGQLWAGWPSLGLAGVALIHTSLIFLLRWWVGWARPAHDDGGQMKDKGQLASSLEAQAETQYSVTHPSLHWGKQVTPQPGSGETFCSPSVGRTAGPWLGVQIWRRGRN